MINTQGHIDIPIKIRLIPKEIQRLFATHDTEKTIPNRSRFPPLLIETQRPSYILFFLFGVESGQMSAYAFQNNMHHYVAMTSV